MNCDKEEIIKVGAHPVWTRSGDPNIFFISKMSVDADGSPRAYHPNGRKGLDALGNAGKPGNWWALVTDNGKKTGNPLVQGEDDPAPGFYISKTSLEDKTKRRKDPHRYIDAEKIPFIALPPEAIKKAKVKTGDFAAVVNSANGRLAFAVVADVGPKGKIGEGSIALAEALGVPSSPRKGGAKNGIIYLVFPGSGNGKPRPLGEINSEGKRLFDNWGGMTQLRKCFDTFRNEQLEKNVFDVTFNVADRLTFSKVKEHVSANNKCDISNEAVIALIWKESGFDPKAKNSGSTATGLMQMTIDAVQTVNNTTPSGVHFEHAEMTDPVKNIQCGTYYLKFFRRNLEIKEALEHFGTGAGYADNILQCETCLNANPPNPQTCLNVIHT